MRIVNLSDGKQYTKGDIFNRRWREILTILSLLVLILTVYIFMLPAVTMEKSCGLTEHTHTDDCYETIETKVLTCTTEETDGHQHTDECYDDEGNLICEETEAPPHQHTDECYELREEKKLICEIKEHVHNAECYKSNNESESKSDDASGDPNDSENSTAADPDDQNAEAKAEEYETDTPQYTCGKDEHEHDENCYNADGELICEAEEHKHTKDYEAQTEEADEQPTEEQQEIESRFIKEVEALEALGELTDADRDAADDLLTQLQESYLYEEITADTYADLYGRILALLETGYEAVAEAAEGTNWIKLRDSGWFEEYSDAGISSYSAKAAAEEDISPSSQQVDNAGGTSENKDDGVNVSKTIKGTDLENVFDITLTVQTPQKIDEVISEPDMAVVIVMDISNTMNDNFGGVTRYAAAMEAAEDFLDNFAANNELGVSKVGYVAFNTDAHQIFGLQSCTNETQANALKNTMRTATGSIINADGYGVAHNRFTNIEGGLKMAQDMLNGVSNKNKFIILLTDGFPTTYLESGYKGYDPYDTTGRFYDHVLNVPCSSGTSYSDEAAIRARNMAASIKNSGTTIFSIGVDVGGQTIQAYIESSEKLAKGDAKISIVDRTGTTYEIGSATSTEAYKNWLENSIGSGYYYDSTNTAGLKDAYGQIFTQIKTTIEEASKADWVATDPIPIVTGAVEFIGFYDKENELKVDQNLVGSNAENAENTASIEKGSNDNTSGTDPAEGTSVAKDDEITWDLKKSGYVTSDEEGKTIYTYTLKYRVRLKNEQSGFVENQSYNTNGTTTLAYRVVTTVNGNTTMSESKTIEFLIPSVHGYLGELIFNKIDNLNRLVSGAEFTLVHDTEACGNCRGDNEKSVEIGSVTAISGEDGKVEFKNIPSGHTYTLKETKVPDGYYGNGKTYTVTVAYDEVTVKVSDGELWNDTIVNYTSYELPQTGGGGTVLYTAGGMALILSAVLLLCCKAKRRRERSAPE